MFAQILGGAPAFAKREKKQRRADSTVINPDFRIMEVICGLAGKFAKTYCFPTQEKLVQLVADFTGRQMSVRTLNRHLAALEAGQWLKRTRRHMHDKQRGFIFRSTLYRPMWRYCQRLQRNARAIFSLLGAQGAVNPTRRVTKMAENLNIFFKKFISDAAKGQSPRLRRA